MLSASLKRHSLNLHRWLALALAPVFLLILLSGAVLALKPIQGVGHPAVGASPAALVATLDAVDPTGQATAVRVAADGRSMALKTRDPAASGTFALPTLAGADTPDGLDSATRGTAAILGFDPFDLALDLHKRLLMGAGLVVKIATYAMVILLPLGLVLGWPRLRHTVRGWHLGLGWVGLPLVALTPVTGLLLTLHLGMPRPPTLEPGAPIPLARAIAAVAAQQDGTVALARRWRDGGALVQVVSPSGERLQLVHPDGTLTPMGGPGWVKALHEGTWAGPWSGALNLLSALALLGLLGTGVGTWVQRRRRRWQRRLHQGLPRPAIGEPLCQ